MSSDSEEDEDDDFDEEEFFSEDDEEHVLYRSKDRATVLGEVFTPDHLVELMLDGLESPEYIPFALGAERWFEIPLRGEAWPGGIVTNHIFTDPTKKILEPAVGNGQIVAGLLKRLLAGLADTGFDEKTLHRFIFENMIFALDISPENIAECIRRFNLYDLKHHFVCADALTYHMRFDEWETGQTHPLFVFRQDTPEPKLPKARTEPELVTWLELNTPTHLWRWYWIVGLFLSLPWREWREHIAQEQSDYIERIRLERRYRDSRYATAFLQRKQPGFYNRKRQTLTKSLR